MGSMIINDGEQPALIEISQQLIRAVQMHPAVLS